jgi:uncharacterized protein (DUF608 family)
MILFFAFAPLLLQAQPLSGVPLGGLGAGKFEVFEDGSFGEATFQHNPKDPLEMKASFLAVRIEKERDVVVRALRTLPVLGFEPASPLEFEGLFPRARLAFRDLPVEVEVEAFSPLIPGDPETSAYPGAIFVLRTANPGAAPARVSVMCAMENLLGCGGPLDRSLRDRTGNFVDVIARGPHRGLRFVSDRSFGDARRNQVGEYALLAEPPADGSTSLSAYDAASGGTALRADFAAEGALDGSLALRGIEGRIHPGGALAVAFEIPPGGRRECAFAFAWSIPHFVAADGRDRPPRYTKRFASAGDAASWALRSRQDLLARTRWWQDLVFDSSLPGWLCRKLLNDASVLFANTIWTAEGEFATLESLGGPEGTLGAMDRRLASHGLLAAFFPELDRSELARFAAAQRADGSVPRSLAALLRSTDLSAARPAPEDAAAFVLQVAKTYRWTGERDFLESMAPSVRAALAWLEGCDADGDGLPEGTEKDGRESANASILYLAAARAGADLARTLGDAALRRDLEDRVETARRAIVGGFWNGDYFRDAFDPRTGAGSNACGLSQLAGEWFATLLGTGTLLPPDLVDRALDSVLRLNGRISPYLPPLLVEPDGRWASSTRARVSEAQAYLAALAIARGRVDEGLEVLEVVDRTLRERGGDAWGSPDEFDALTGDPLSGRGSSGRSSTWFSLYALAGFSLDAAEETLQLAPNFPRGSTRVVVPLFTPNFVAVLDAESPAGTPVREIRFEVRRRLRGAPLRLSRVLAMPPPTVPRPGGRVSVSLDGRPVPATVKVEGDGLVAELVEPIVLDEGRTLAIRVGGPPGPIEVDAPTAKVLHGTGSVRVERLELAEGFLRLRLWNETGVEEAIRLRVRGWPTEEIAWGDRRLRRADLEEGIVLRVPGRVVPDREMDVALAALGRLRVGSTSGPPRERARLEELERRIARGLRVSEGAAALEIALQDPAIQAVDVRPAGLSRGTPEEEKGAALRAQEARDEVLAALREEVSLLREALREREVTPGAPALPDEMLAGVEIATSPLRSISPGVALPLEVSVRNRFGSRTRGRITLEVPEGCSLRGGEGAEIDDLRPGEEFRLRRTLVPSDEAAGRRRSLVVRGWFELGGVWFERSAKFPVGRAPLDRWQAVGPFDGADPDGFDRVLAPEAGIDLGATYPGKGGPVAWKSAKAPGGRVDLELTFGRVDAGIAYAVTWVRSPEERDVFFEIETDDRAKVWLEREALPATSDGGGSPPNRLRIPARLRADWNRILLKTEERGGDWSFLFEIVDPAGESYDDFEVSDRFPGPG